MRSILFVITIATIISFPSQAIRAQYLHDKCTVRSTWWDNETGYGGANYILGQFEPEKGFKPTIRSFKYSNTDWVVTAGFKYLYSYSGTEPKPVSIELAVMVSDKMEKMVFEAEGSSVAEIDYLRDWDVAVNKNFPNKSKGKDRRYQITLSCWDDSKNLK